MHMLAEFDDLSPGYDGVYTNKAGKVAEGSATFWRRSRYRVAARVDLNMRQLFATAASTAAVGAASSAPSADLATPAGHEGSQTSDASEPAGRGVQSQHPAADIASADDAGAVSRHARFAPLLQALPHLAATLQQVGTIAQALVLVPAAADAAAAPDAGSNGAAPVADLPANHRDGRNGAAEQKAANATSHGQKSQNPAELSCEPSMRDAIRSSAEASDEEALCVVNTHLFYHPWAPHIRILHVAAMLDEAVALAQRTQQALALRRRPALLFCGDLNSDLSWGMPGVSSGRSTEDHLTYELGS